MNTFLYWQSDLSQIITHFFLRYLLNIIKLQQIYIHYVNAIIYVPFAHLVEIENAKLPAPLTAL